MAQIYEHTHHDNVCDSFFLDLQSFWLLAGMGRHNAHGKYVAT